MQPLVPSSGVGSLDAGHGCMFAPSPNVSSPHNGVCEASTAWSTVARLLLDCCSTLPRLLLDSSAFLARLVQTPIFRLSHHFSFPASTSDMVNGASQNARVSPCRRWCRPRELSAQIPGAAYTGPWFVSSPAPSFKAFRAARFKCVFALGFLFLPRRRV